LRFHLLVSLLFLRICVHGQSTDTSIARIITNLRNFYELNPIEKCYLHIDKDFYQPGETIFFKAYLSLNNSFSTLSNVIYTDITDVNGNLLHKSMWPAASGVSHGSIFLQDTLPTGIYRIRGYNLWMLNQKHTIGEQYVFVQGKKDQSKSFQAISTGLTANIFPESGTIVHGVPNRIAFRLSDANKLPVNNATAVLTDDAGNEVAKPVLFESGTGLLEFTPDANRKYQLTVSYNQTKKNFSLPTVAFNALNLKVDNISPTKLFVQTNASEEFIKNNPSVYVLLQQNGITVSAQKFNLAEAQNATVINKKNLNRGLLQVVVLNEKTELVSNRWIWVNTVEPSALQLETTALSFQPKGKNELTLIFKGTDTPSLSVSVIPADLPSYNFFNNPTVMSYMMVHSNQNSEPFVFNYRNQSTTDDMYKLMDALTITMSPSITGWSEITGGIQPPLSYFFETGISIRGFVKKDRDKMEFDSSKIDIIIKSADSSTIFGTSKVDERGAFAVNNLHFQKNADVSGLATSKDKKRRKVDFQLLPSYIDTLSAKTQKPFFNPVYTQQSGFEFSSAAPIGVGGVYPSSANYAAVIPDVNAGADFGVRLALGTPPATTRDSLLFNFRPTLQRKKYYTFFLCDSISRPNSRILAVEDDIKIPSADIVRVRFVNLIPNPPTATPAIDVYSSLNNTLLFPAVPFRGVTQFLELTRNSGSSTVTDTYTLRWAGTTTTIGTVAVIMQNQGSYTVFARGFVGATGARAPGASAYRNR
jgi:hypothetical protein